MRGLPAFLATTLLLVAWAPAYAQRSTEQYDPVFRKYSRRFFGPAFDWRLFKAQGMTESNLDSAAASRAGARGVMQLMPSTFQEIQNRNPDFTTLDEVEWNIAAGIFHDRRLWRLWGDSVETQDHGYFMLGSYNAGHRAIVRARNVARLRALDPRLWASIVAVAADVPGWRQRETLAYLVRVQQNLTRMDWRGRVARR